MVVHSESNSPHASTDLDSTRCFFYDDESVACEFAARRCLRRFWSGTAEEEYRKLPNQSECLKKDPTMRRQRLRWHLCLLGSVRVPATTDTSETWCRKSAAEPVSRVGRRTWRVLPCLSWTGRKSAAAAAVVESPPAVIYAMHVQGA